MKNFTRFLFFAVAFMFGVASVSAQEFAEEIDNTFRFVDKAGNVIPHGGSYTVYAKDHELFPGYSRLEAVIDLDVENTSSEEAAVAAHVITEKLDGGSFQFCFPNSCPPVVPSDYTTDTGVMASGEKKDLQAEWMPTVGQYGESRFSIQVHLMEQQGLFNYVFAAYGPKITVRCIYADPTGIDDITAAADATINVYDMSGRSILTNATPEAFSALRQGVYVCEKIVAGNKVATRKVVKK
ncbi:MAG: T9SS type A sorting domain-containing protein [Prevotella sp.]